MVDFGIYNNETNKYIVEADLKKREITSILLLLDKADNKNTFAFLDKLEEVYPVREEKDDYCFECKAKIPETIEEVPKVAQATHETAVLDKIIEKAEEQAIIEEAKENTEEILKEEKREKED